MHFIVSVFITLWAWEFIRNRINQAPDWLVHLGIVPSISYLSWIIPEPYRYVLGITGVIMLIQMLVVSVRTAPQSTKRRSNIPPPP